MKNGLFMLFAALLVLLCFGCSKVTDMTNAKQLAGEEVEAFHAKFNTGNFDELLKTLDRTTPTQSSDEKWLEIWGAMRRKLGNTTASTQANWQISNFNGKTRAVVIFNTTFEKGTGTETFSYTIADGKASLFGYNISSTDLIVK